MTGEQKPPNAANPESLRERAKKDKLKARERKEAWRKVVEMREGRMVLAEIMNDYCGIEDQFPSLAQESMQYSEGRRVVGLKIKKLIRREFPNALLLMNKELIDQEIMDNG